MTNERQWADHVEGVFETPFGVLKFAVTNADHVYIDGRPTPKDGSVRSGIYAKEPVTINRVLYHLSAHLHRKPDGTWDAKDSREIYLSRPGSSKAFDYSLAAVQKARTVLSATWTKYASEHPDLFCPAQLGHLNNDIMRLDTEIAEKEKELADLKVKRDALLEKESALNGART